MTSPKDTSELDEPGSGSLDPISSPRVGRITGIGKAGSSRLLVDFPGNLGPPVQARAAMALDEEAIRDAVAKRQGVLLLFEEGDPARPILIGLIHQQSETPCLDLVLSPEKDPEEPQKEKNLAEVLVDGERVILEGQDEVVLRCGKASITLRRNGKVVIRGTYLVSRSEGTNRIKGGTVQIN